MGRRRRSNRSRFSNTVIPYDFWGQAQGSSKIITCEDLGLTRNRTMRPVRAVCTVVWQYSGYAAPCAMLSLFDTKADVCAVSQTVICGGTSRSMSCRATRATDFGDYHSDKSNVLTIIFPGYASGTITYSGTVWIQIAPHKVATHVSIAQRLARFALVGRDEKEPASGDP